MLATYSRNSRLNVREAPGGEVVGTLEPGQTVACELVEAGWAKVEGGWVKADLVTVTDGSKAPDERPTEPTPEPEPDTAAAEAEDYDALMAKTRAELMEMARSRGLGVGAKACKPEIVAALLNG